MVAGLVVHVGTGVDGVTRCRLDLHRAPRQGHRLVEAALLLADERQQPGVPPVVAVGRLGALDDRPGVPGTVVTPAKAMVGTATLSSSASRGHASRWRISGHGVAGDVLLDGEHVAAFALGAAPSMQSGGVEPGSMSTAAQYSCPSSASAAWPRAKVGSWAIDSATPSMPAGAHPQ